MSNNTTAKEYLGRYLEEKKAVMRLYARADAIQARVTSITGKLSDMPRSESPNPQRMREELAVAMDLEAEAAKMQEYLKDLRSEIWETLSLLDDPVERDALASRYLDDLSWSEIAELFHYSEATIYRIRQRAMDHILPLIPAVDSD